MGNATSSNLFAKSAVLRARALDEPDGEEKVEAIFREAFRQSEPEKPEAARARGTDAFRDWISGAPLPPELHAQ